MVTNRAPILTPRGNSTPRVEKAVDRTVRAPFVFDIRQFDDAGTCAPLRLTDTRLISRPEVVDTGRRRRWSEAAKLRIVGESLSGARLVSATARRYGISNQLLFAWRKAYREGRLGAVAGFVPVTIAPEPREEGGCGRIEIAGANCLRFVVDAAVDVEALARIMRGVEAL